MAKLGAYWFSQLCVWGLTGSCALLALAGIVGSFAPGSEFLGISLVAWCVTTFALVTAFSISGVNVMASAIMHAVSRPGGWRAWHWPTVIPATVCLLIFSLTSNVGVHLGWGVLRDAAPDAELPNNIFVGWILSLLPFAKPLSMLAIAGRHAIDQKRLDEEKRAEQSRAESVVHLELHHRHTEKMARIAARSSNKNASSASDMADDRSSKTVRPVSGNGPTAEDRERARSLLVQGHKPIDVHRMTGVPHGTLKRQVLELRRSQNS